MKRTIPTSAWPAAGAFVLLAGLAACAGGAPAGTTPPEPADGPADAAATITAQDVAREIGALAHDSMAGRDTPSPELEQAAAYLADRFRSMGLEPAGENGTYIDRYDYEVTRLVADETVVRVQGAGTAPRYEADYFLVPGPGSAEAQAVYVGVAGETSPPADAGRAIWIYDHPGAELNQEWQLKLMGAVQAAAANGAAGLVLVLDPEFPGEMLAPLASMTAAQQGPFPIVGITDAAARQLAADAGEDLDALREDDGAAPLGEAVIEIRASRGQETHTPPNVVAMLRGSDPALRDEYVVVTAHFDHVGVGAPDETGDSIYNGADDDASGTAAVVEIAEAFAALPEAPARSVIFLAVSGEEKGLLGSMAYAEDPPVIDIDDVVANVNMDMVGRNAPDTVIAIGQEYSSLERVLAGITADHPDLGLNVILDPVPEENFFFRSDQLAFIQQGIPAVFFTTHEHE
ncbi:MAG: M28 family peptidase, partial [Gemmatimonadetes bacterium]|nr:M28 family peptidase [Gemmatimonadota bacterium]NIU74149.1 M28 family peptidase [Gammaproteobacteria bacterium]NIP79273.1 M28 family peptidase [Gemmatimonadota bacterium]NIQ53968.1 M28 family peptidase [Gemmatimonadota bacterium]NIW38867.1 M28 family peptidase [Gemmatimonadota bacterium]